jgi:hypothetical protein
MLQTAKKAGAESTFWCSGESKVKVIWNIRDAETF